MAESRRTHAHDPSGEPLGGDPQATPAPTGNRPATGAREMSAVAVDPAWQGGQGATDFLGLEPDIRPAGAPGGGQQDGPTDSWLFEIEQHDAAASAPAASTAVSASHGDDGSAADLDALESGELETSNRPRATPRRSGARRLLTAVFCLALIGVPAWFGWQRYGARITRKIEMAMKSADPAPAPAPAPTAAPKPAAKPKLKPPVAATTPAPAATTSPAATPSGDPLVSSAPNTNVPEITGAQSDPSETSLTALDPVQPPTPAPTTTATAPTATEPALVRNADPARAPELPTAGAPGPGGGRHANEKDWAGMWLEPTIPMEAIRGPTRLRTLHVGAVRLQLTNGEYIEGTLNAVGESRVWVDVPLGRMSFAAGDIRDLKQIVGSQGQPLPAGAQALAGLKRVEVLMPGGWLTGRILERQGDNVTFVTEAGMRVSVEALDVRPVSTGGSRLVGPVAGRKP